MHRLAPRPRAPRIRVLLGGHFVIGFTILVGVIAAHTGAGQLHAIAALLLAFQAVSGFRSFRGLRHLCISVELPARAVVGEASTLRVRIENGKRRAAAHSIEVEFVVTPDGPARAAAAWIERLEPRGTVEIAVPLAPSSRGIAQVVELRLSSAYPAHLFRRTLRLPIDAEIAVSPAPVRVSPLPPAHTRRSDGRASDPSVGAGEFRGVRPWRVGESPRAIHARTSARRGAPVAREEESTSRPSWTLVADPRGLEAVPLESSLAAVASLLRASRRAARRCSFRLAGLGRPIDVRDAASLHVALDAVARYLPTGVPPPIAPSVGPIRFVGAVAESPTEPDPARKDRTETRP